MTLTKNHFIPADYIRAIASLVVTIYHLGGKTQPVLNYGWLGVQMFFVLSGFIICYTLPHNYSTNQSFKFLLKRFVRINFPYLFSIFLLVALNTLSGNLNEIKWTNVLLHFFYLNTYFNQPSLNPVYWTLAIEFQFYILIALFFPILKKNLGLVILCFLNIIFVYYKLGIETVFSFLPLFSIGILAYKLIKQNKKIDFYIGTALAVIFICSFLTSGVLQTAVALFTFLILFIQLPQLNIISFFSKISFSLYLVHDIVGSRLVVYLGNYVPSNIYYKASIFAAGLITSIFCAWLFNLIIEKPFLAWSKSIHYSSKNKTQVFD